MEVRRWEEMGTDCLVRIFERVSLEDLILGVPFVCKSWHEASTSPLCWKSLDFFQLDLHPESDFVAKFKQRYRVEKFSFTSFLKFTVHRSRQSAVEIVLPSLDATYVMLEDLDYLAEECPALKQLSLPYLMFTQVEKHIPNCISKWNKLEQLRMHGMPVSFVEIVSEISRHCKSFNKLETSGSFGNQEASAIATSLPRIKQLCLSKSYMSKEALMVILRGCTELEILDMKYCRGFRVDDEIKELASHIRSCDFDGCAFRRRFLFANVI